MSAVLGFLPGTECKECKGRCCKEHGCVLSPEDMISSIEKFLGYSISQEILASIWKEYYQKFMEDGTFDKNDDAYFEYIKSKAQQGK